MTNYILPRQLQEAAVFPLEDFQKKPVVKWKDYEKGISDDNPTYGVDCGRSNLIVVDLDRNHSEADGIAEWKKLLKEHPTAKSFSVRTPNGGVHVYYSAAKGTAIKNSAGKLGPAIDIRAAGGYVVGPNSRVLDNEGNIQMYKVIEDTDIAPVPQWLVKELAHRPEPVAPVIGALDFPDEYARRALEGAVLEVMRAGKGSRNDTLNRESFGAAKAGAPLREVIQRMTQAASSIGLPQAEVTATVKRAAEEGAAHFVPRAPLRLDPTTGQVDPASVKLEPLKKTDPQYYSDLLLTERFAKDKRARLRYVADRADWLAYSAAEGIWEVFPEKLVIPIIDKWLNDQYTKARYDNEIDKATVKVAERCLSRSVVRNILDLVAGRLGIRPEQLNKKPELLVVKNGVLDLRTGKLSDFDSSLLITMRVPIEYDATATSEVLPKILACIPEDSHDWLQLMLGQTLTGFQTTEPKVFFMAGSGANGKSTLIDLMAATAGSYGGRPPQTALIQSGRGVDHFSMVRFRDIHQALIEELPEQHLDIRAIKNLTGTDGFQARDLHQSFEEVNVIATTWVSCNRLPSVSDTDWGTWRRLVVVPFPYTYKETQAHIKGVKDRLADPKVKQATKSDPDLLKAFLAWRVEGAKRWLTEPTLEAHKPPAVVEASEGWRAMSDLILGWSRQCLDADQNYFTLTNDLLESFNTWAKENGYAGWSQKTFLDRLQQHEFFLDHHMVYKQGSTTASLDQSLWQDPNDRFKSPRAAGRVVNHVRGVRFRDDSMPVKASFDTADDDLMEDIFEDKEIFA